MKDAHMYCSKSLLLAILLGPACGESSEHRDELGDGGVGQDSDAGAEDDGSTDGENSDGAGDDGAGDDGGSDDGDDDGETDGQGNDDGSSDGGASDSGDSDTSGTDCHNDIDWGNAGAGNTPIDQDVGQVIANWSHTGYIDQDGDGIVETEQVSFNMEDVHCTGKKSMLVLMGDTY